MTTPTQSDLLLDLIRLHTIIQRQLAGQLSYHGISLTEYLVLRQLHHAPNKKMRRIDLAQQVGLSASGVTRLLNPMQKTGLIDKQEAVRDARVSLVGLTDAGEQVFRDASVSFDQAAQSLLDGIGSKERSNLARITSLML